ncbi:hypothetical protein AB0G02_31665, partial [Actinosynnema sp. NPDC023658]|uniref:hypothetical protein n=1 Tax=Actinosynnema sp. NPDC023658 TaxID=3155465 RepID=UPI0033DE6732
ELACLMAAVDRDPDVLHRDLLRGMRSSKVPDGSAILSLLLPPESLHRVALVVHGARDLERLEAFDPSAVVSGLRRSELPGTSDANAVVSSLRHPEKLEFGHATDHLPWLVRQLNGTGPACLVSCEVSAVDVASAGRHARRHVSELLDQYMAGHRLVDLRLGEEVLVLPQGAMRAKHLSSRRPTLNTAVPLTRDWPQPLRNTLRMAHVARTTSSPLPAAALAWSALEACELARKTQELARALSLQSMRQQIVEAYRQLGQAATAAERGAREAMASASKAAQSLARAAGKCDPDKAAYPDLRRRADQADDRHLVARGRHRALQALFDDRLTAVERHVKRTEADRLDDINAWVDLLLSGTPADTPETVDARDALNHVAAEVSALPAFQVTEWSTRLADPRACADWLVDRQDRIATLLSALYSARNLSLHAGQFRAVDDLTLATGGSLLVDVTLEVLGNWYRNAGTTRPHTAPEIISCLAKRQQHLVEDLRRGGAVLRDLDVALLTSPTPSGRWPHR